MLNEIAPDETRPNSESTNPGQKNSNEADLKANESDKDGKMALAPVSNEDKLTVKNSTTTLSNPESKKGKKNKNKLETEYKVLNNRFHRIYWQLEIEPTLEKPLIVGVTSAVRGEGRTVTAMGLASAIAEQVPLPVVLVEADLDRPSLATDLNLPNRGVAEFVREEAELSSLIQATSLGELSIVFAGDAQGQGLKTLRSGRFSWLINMLSQQFAAVVVDMPPMSQTGEATRVISQVDRVLMVVEAGSTPGKLAKSTLELLPPEKFAGVVLNRTRPSFGLMRLFDRIFLRG